MDSFGYIYKTTNKINGKIYIGQKSGSFHPSYFGSGIAIVKAVLKYGRENFKTEIVAFASNKPMLDELEIKNIAEYRNAVGREFLYNMTDGGEGTLGFACSEEKKMKLRVSALKQFSDLEKIKRLKDMTKRRLAIKENNPMFGKKHSDETKKKISESNKGPNLKLRGRSFSVETRDKMRENWIERKKVGFSEATREKMRQSHLGMKHTAETKEKMVAHHRSKQ